MWGIEINREEYKNSKDNIEIALPRKEELFTLKLQNQVKGIQRMKS
jgi:hypothetical protein